MKRALVIVAVGVGVAGFAPPAPADFGLGLFKRRQQARADQPAKAADPAKPDPDEAKAKGKAEPLSKVKQIVLTLQADPDAAKRQAAVAELARLDPRTNPEVLPALVASLQRDPAEDVRVAAADAVGGLKPVSQSAGLAMEAALASDPVPRVRETIKAALWQYHLNGYQTPPSAPTGVQSAEPGYAARPRVSTSASPAVRTDTTFKPITSGVGKAISVPPSPEPPLARPKPAAKPVPPASGPVLTPTVAVPPPAATGPAVPLPAIPTVPVPPATE